MCGDCYDYTAAVLFNACTRATCGAGSPPTCPATWPAWPASPQEHLRAELRIRYVKVAEYQARGVVHFHAVIRLDAHRRRLPATPGRYTADAAVRRHRPGRRRRPPPVPALRRHRRPGSASAAGTDARPIRRQTTCAATGQRAGLPGRGELHRQVRHQDPDRPGLPDQRHPPPVDVDALRCSAHYKRMIATAWQLGGKHRTATRGFASGHTCSATAATSSPNPAATPSPSASSAPPAPSTAGAQRHPDGERDPWGRPLDEPRRPGPRQTGPTPEPATPPPRPAQSWRSRRPTWHVAR